MDYLNKIGDSKEKLQDKLEPIHGYCEAIYRLGGYSHRER